MSLAAHRASLVDQQSPCIECQFSALCKTELLACELFRQYVVRGVRHDVLTKPRLPSRELYRAAMEATA